MRLTTLLLFIGCLQASASGIGQVVTLKEKAVSIDRIFKQIKAQTGYEFLYNTLSVEKAKPVTIDVKGMALEEALRICFASQPFTYKIINRTIIVFEESSAKREVVSAVPPNELTGRVLDEDGLPLEGVSISIKENGIGTTKKDGSFTVRVPEATNTLVFSFVGYVQQEVAINGKSNITIRLRKENAVLNDVVVVGYGKSARQNLSSAVSTVKGEDLNRGAITDIGQLIQGKVPGLNITASGDPNRPAAVIMRGASTLNSSQSPLYVIDGVPGADISIIAPDDIATIDVLKDAAATAIYGNRAANGVIMITSKRGKKGLTQVAYSGYVGTEKVSNELEMMDASQLRAFLAKNSLTFTPADDKGANTNWQKEIRRSSVISHNHNISVSGGGEHSTYSASLNYVKKEGVIMGSDLSRVVARLALDQYLVNDKVKFGITITNSNSVSNNVPNRNNVLMQSVNHLPVSTVQNADGTYFENFTNPGYFNPVALIKHGQDNTKYNVLVGSLNTQVKLPFGLTYDIVLSYQNANNLHGEYYDSYYAKYGSANFYNNPDPPINRTLLNFGANGSALRSSYQNTSKILETFFTWDRKFGGHTINAVLGYSWQGNVAGEGFQATTTNFPTDNVGYNNLSLSNPYAISSYQVNFGPGNAYQETRLISDFGRLNYNYKNKYLLQASVRRDGSSVFGANHQWGYFPAAGAAWRISQEAFMQQQQLFTELKLRASYGVTGNATGFDAYTAQFISGGLGSFYYNGTLQTAYGPVQAANPDLQWEKTATTNIGLDFTVLKGKLSGSLDVYNKNTTGMIYGYTVNAVLIPAGKIIANGGSMNNKGIELSVNATPVTNKNFSWTTALNLAHNRNEITSLTNPLFAGGDSVRMTSPAGSGQTGSTLQILKAGKPLGQFFTFEYAGKDQNGISQYLDSKGMPTIAPAIGTDYKYVGDPQPKLMLGFTNTFRYKNFDLNVFMRGVFGNKIFNVTKADLFRPNTAQYYNIPVEVENESVKDINAYKYSSRFIESGSFLRLDNATLGYSFKNVNRYVRNFRVYTSVNNLFVITNYTGVDPEINQGGLAPGMDTNNFYPKTRTVLVGVNLGF